MVSQESNPICHKKQIPIDLYLSGCFPGEEEGNQNTLTNKGKRIVSCLNWAGSTPF